MAQISTVTVESRSLIFRRRHSSQARTKFCVKMKALDDCLSLSLLGLPADGPEWKHLRGEGQAADLVIID